MIEVTDKEWITLSFALEDMIDRKLGDKDTFPLGEEDPIIKRHIALYSKIEEHNYNLYIIRKG